MKQESGEHEFSYKDYVYNLKAAKPQFLHTMLCVHDLEASERFYVEGLGMKVLDRMSVDVAPRVDALFIGFEIGEGILELSCFPDGDSHYARRPGFGHIALGVPDLDAVLRRLESMGVDIKIPPQILIPGAPLAAFLDDPDGYEVELIQTSND